MKSLAPPETVPTFQDILHLRTLWFLPNKALSTRWKEIKEGVENLAHEKGETALGER